MSLQKQQQRLAAPSVTASGPTRQEIAYRAVLELAMTAITMFVVVTVTRWFMDGFDPAAGEVWNSLQGRIVVMAPLGGYTVTALMLSPGAAAPAATSTPPSPWPCGATGRSPAARSRRTSPEN
ncbi:hypothetical protein [Streptomyces niphimycinicus]|uniref:hypothetical protein n=1 Tax=Streptomyces niphimycinicus TaxID=2842201 RepID=UPI00209A7C3B|nr:hypothetical protein [Streptomyces niphimycinicus]